MRSGHVFVGAIVSAVTAILGVGPPANGATVTPVGYDMIDGYAPQYGDHYYTVNGTLKAQTSPYQFLSGGTGVLTDGYKELSRSWNPAQFDTNNAHFAPYVGWDRRDLPDITFRFAETVNIDSVTIYFDNPNGHDGSVGGPAAAHFTAGGTTVDSSTQDNANLLAQFAGATGPASYTFSNLNLTGNSVEMKLDHFANGFGSDWVFLSEVEFNSAPAAPAAVPLPTAAWGGLALLGGLGANRLRRRRGAESIG